MWFAQVDATNTTIWAQFKGVNPNEQLVEINVRRTVFYPEKPGMNYITVRGFTLAHAATPWAPPTAEQVGLIGTHWSKGWIIENNAISHSICSGIALGKYGDQWDNTSANTAEGYVKTIERALKNGWNKETIGHHIVRNNTISHCEQAGIVGSLGAAFSTVTGNVIHDIHVRRLFTGARWRASSFTPPSTSTIRRNHIYRTCLGLWLDWMAQGTRVSGNLFHDNDRGFVRRGGPRAVSGGQQLVPVRGHFAGRVRGRRLRAQSADRENHQLAGTSAVPRPTIRPHSTALAGLTNVKGGDDRFYNNILVGGGGSPVVADKPPAKNFQLADGFGLCVYDARQFPLQTGGNVYYNGARPYFEEVKAVVQAAVDPKVRVVEEGRNVYLHLTLGPAVQKSNTTLVTTELLGKAKISGLPYENPDGSPLKIDTDYFGKSRNEAQPNGRTVRESRSRPTHLESVVAPQRKRLIAVHPGDGQRECPPWGTNRNYGRTTMCVPKNVRFIVPMLGALALLQRAAPAEAAGQRPNVIFVLTDDQGYGDLSCHGNPVLKTPNLDKLHDESIRLTDFHVSPMCTPSRGQLMTGRDALHNGATCVLFGTDLYPPRHPDHGRHFRCRRLPHGDVRQMALGRQLSEPAQDRGFQQTVYHPSWGITSTPDYLEQRLFRRSLPAQRPGGAVPRLLHRCLVP